MKKYHRLRRIDPNAAPRSYEYHLIDSQGNVKNVLTTADVIPGTKKHVSSFVDITALKEKEKELMDKSQSLADLNTALKVLLKQREEDRAELENALLSNIKLLVMPNIEKLSRSNIDDRNMIYVDLLASNLENILSPFSHKLAANLMNLTPTEIQVVNLIKGGKSSKQIAELLSISRGAIDVYRYRIRTKLGLERRTNLRSYLTSLA
ncbi:LuxR family transcriptional regulator [bacterium]|nr:LuxR family transcriptional regulator [bacterium]